MIKPFSEDITTGAPYPTSVSVDMSIADTSITDTYTDISITTKHLQRGNDLDEKVKIYFNRVGLVRGPRKEWIEWKLKTEWKDEKHLQHQSPKSKGYNNELLDFLTSQDYEYQFSQAIKGKEPLPKEIQKYLKTQIDELLKKPIKARGKEQIALSRREQEKIYASPGVVPTWWWHDPKEGTYTYHAIKAIKKTKASARDVQLTVEKAASGKPLDPYQANIISAGWGLLSKEGRELLSGKLPTSEKMFRKYGEFYHRDVGWY